MSNLRIIGHSEDGSPIVQLYLNRKKRPQHTFSGMTDEEALDAAKTYWHAHFIVGMECGDANGFSSLLDAYIDYLPEDGRKESTCTTYRSLMRKHIRPYFGERDPKGITPEELSSFYVFLVSKSGLSGVTVHKVAAFIQGGFRWMSSMGICQNAAIGVRKPRGRHKDAFSLDDAQYRAAMSTAAIIMASTIEDEEDFILFAVAFASLTALATGMRCGEVCGLLRGSVELREGVYHVKVCNTATEKDGSGVKLSSTKNNKVRDIAMPEYWARALPVWLEKSERFTGIKGMATKKPLITLDGSLLRPSTLSYRFRCFRLLAGLPSEAHFHSLRHTHATLLLRNGVPIQVVSSRLGHASAATTLKIYAHVLPGFDEQAAGIMDELDKRIMGGTDDVR